MVLISTYLSSITYFFHFIIWSIAFLIYFITPNPSPTNLQSNNKSYSRIIENFRGQILIVTCICILAVDFAIFPRRYAKTEDYGYSGMDLGVGLFALAHGMVSSEARNKQTNLKELFLENFILIILGLIRLISIKYFSYVEHISEYGIHWNFFLTLCFMKLIGNCLLMITKNILILIFITLLFHEFILLKYFQFDQYLISSDNIRMNFIDANREGIFSLGGYVCLYLIGIYIGRLVMTNERDQQFQYMSIRFTISTIILCGISSNPSRKLCNLSYISSTTGLACMCMAGFSVVQWLLLRKGLFIESILLKNVNQKGLDTFLFANVFTGIINLNINTIDTSNFISLMIILIYMFIVTVFAYFSPSLIKLIMKYLKLSKS
jgi:phosphatidylinositol glycan class W